MTTSNAKRLASAIILPLLVNFVTLQAQNYTSQGADSCLSCHSEGQPKPATAIFFTKHASRTDPKAPFSNLSETKSSIRSGLAPGN